MDSEFRIRQTAIKSETNQMGWRRLKAGDEFWAVVKCQVLEKGEKHTPLAKLRCLSTSRERLDSISPADVNREGFPQLTPADFVAMFSKMNGCKPKSQVTRIAFAYVEVTAGDLVS